MKVINQSEFEQLVAANEKPILVDFFATWCGPCRAMHPILESAEKTPEGQGFTFVQVDVDRDSQLAASFGIQSVPTIVVIKDGKIVYRQPGLHQPQILARVLKEHA